MDLTFYRSLLRIDKNRLDEALEVQADHQDRISEQVARLNTRSSDLKKTLEEVEARIIEDLKADDPKLSNPIAEKEAKRHADWKRAWREYQAAREEFEVWTGLHMAWVSRGYQLKTLADLYASQYFAISSTSAATSRAVDDASYESSRRRMRAAASETATPVVRRRPTHG